MTEFNRNAPRFKVGDRVKWKLGNTSMDSSQIVEVLWGKWMLEPHYKMEFGSIIPESLIDKPKLSYDRYHAVEVEAWKGGWFGITLELHFREGHGNSMADVNRLIAKILEEHCEHN